MTPLANSDSDALYEHRHDEGEWEDEPEVIEVRPRRTEVVSFRLPTEEFDRLEEAAQAAGMSLSEFTRGAIKTYLTASAGLPSVPILDFMPGGASFIFQLHGFISSSKGEAPTSWVPDHPPSMVNVTSDEQPDADPT